MRLIDADEFAKVLQKAYSFSQTAPKDTFYALGLKRAEWLMNKEPVIEERKHGHWIYDDPFGALPKCSECGRRSRDAAAEECGTTYCPHCGAVMDKEPNDD